METRKNSRMIKKLAASKVIRDRQKGADVSNVEKKNGKREKGERWQRCSKREDGRVKKGRNWSYERKGE